MADVLVVTTTVGVLDGVHRHTTNLGPALPLDAVLVVGASSLEHGLVEASTSRNDADDGARVGSNDLLGSRGKADGSLALLLIVGDDSAVVARCLGELAAVSRLRLDVANDGTLGHSGERHAVSDGELCLGTAVDELASVDALSGDHHLLVHLVPVRVAKVNAEKGCTTTRIVHHLADDTLDVSIALSVVEHAKLSRAFAVRRVRLEDGVRFALRADNATHF